MLEYYLFCIEKIIRDRVVDPL